VEGAPFLLLSYGARSVAMARAVTAMPGEESVFWNPAGLAGVNRSRAMVLQGDHVLGRSTAVATLLARPGVGTLAFSYLLLDTGDQENTDLNDNLVGALSFRNHLGIVSAAARIVGGLDAGVSVKFVQYRLTCRGRCDGLGGTTTATTYAVDAGLQRAPSPRLPLRLGLMLAHAGPPLQGENAAQADPLPARVRVAAAYDVARELLRRDDVRGWVTVEVQDRPREPGSLSVFVGSELSAGVEDALSLRAGYVVTDPDNAGGVGVGMGLHYKDFELSIARALAVSSVTGEAEPFSVSLSIGL
jgi:hypothetical protein